MYDQNQRDVLKYAHAIVDNGLPPGVLMIDDNWQEDYGKWTFHPGRFPDPKAMMNELHALGFKVMVWVCPFVSPDCDVYRALAKKKAFFMDQPGDPAMVKWWNGKSAMLDLSNPAAKTWFTGELTRLQTTYGVDGFKLDAGDTAFYKAQYLAHEKLDANEHARLFGEIGLAFPLNEYRATWKLAGRPLVQRLRDKSHNWADLEQLIPDMIAAGLLGYTFVCPDLIGGGEFTSFLDQATIDQDLIVRSAQVHALAPMMQFSVAPWRVLDAAHLAAVKQAVALRMRFTPRILELAQASAATGEPILRPLAYVFPDGGYENVKDQFLMGDDLLVAPMVTKGTARTVQIPPGQMEGRRRHPDHRPHPTNLRRPPRSSALLRATVTGFREPGRRLTPGRQPSPTPASSTRTRVKGRQGRLPAPARESGIALPLSHAGLEPVPGRRTSTGQGQRRLAVQGDTRPGQGVVREHRGWRPNRRLPRVVPGGVQGASGGRSPARRGAEPGPSLSRPA